MDEIEDVKEIKLEEVEKESNEKKTEKEDVKEENKKKDKKKMKEKKKKHPFLRFVRGFLIFLIILIVAMAGAGFAFYTSKYGQMQVEEIDENNIGIDAEVDESLEATGYRNIVILGIDSRADDYGVGNRSDGIIIASYNSKTKAVKLTSVYRDTFVDVEERGKVKLDKITHAYSYGQAENTIKSLNKALDLNIKEYVTVNFDAVVDCVDAMGGINMNVTAAEVKYINSYIDENNRVTGHHSKHITAAGNYNLDGIQALAYMRIRYTAGGDYKRAERQRVILGKMSEKAKTLSISQLNNLTNKILPHVKTNISKTEVIGMIPTLLQANLDESIGFPYATEGATIGGVWYGIPCTLEANVEKFHKEVFGQSDYIASDTVKDMSERIATKSGYKTNKVE
jgi:LCP family protein required for cell wall assembly